MYQLCWNIDSILFRAFSTAFRLKQVLASRFCCTSQNVPRHLVLSECPLFPWVQSEWLAQLRGTQSLLHIANVPRRLVTLILILTLSISISRLLPCFLLAFSLNSSESQSPDFCCISQNYQLPDTLRSPIVALSPPSFQGTSTSLSSEVDHTLELFCMSQMIPRFLVHSGCQTFRSSPWYQPKKWILPRVASLCCTS